MLIKSLYRTMTKISVLHISDLHIGKSRSRTVDDFYSTITRDLKEKGFKIDMVICSGDIVEGTKTNKKALFDRALEFFNNLRERINKENLYSKKELIPEDFLFVPGNHDVTRDAEINKKYEQYNLFLEKFYGNSKKNIYSKENKYYYVTKVCPEEKIAFVGLNSCMGNNGLYYKDEEWIENLDFSAIKLEGNKKDQIVDLLKKSKTNYDDFGEIEIPQILGAFDELKSKVSDLESYRIVTFFHHHIYPFPEIHDQIGDASMIRNFPNVINSLINENVKIVLHGHKHIPVSRLVTTSRYFEDTQNYFYVFSTGTLENNGQRGFEMVDVYSPSELMEAQVSKFTYSTEELQSIDEISVPPKYSKKGYQGSSLTEILQKKDLSLYRIYIETIKANDNTSYRYHIDEIIENIEKIILNFDIINNDLHRNPQIVFAILITIHLRILSLDSFYKETENSATQRIILDLLKKELFNNNEDYLSSVFNILTSIKNEEFEKCFKTTFENEKFNHLKKITSYITTTAFFTDLHLAISDFGENYFNREAINHKINIKLATNEFDSKIPNDSIKIVGDEDYRTAIISFVCKNPTVHKASVLIIKDFEERINKIEDAFDFLTLKLYYVRPKVQKDGYEMDNYNFEAYIPSLLPLLTGDNLYSQKEVFVRELIQNSFDAIRLREKLDSTDFDKQIKIKIGKDNISKRRFLKITDEGVGMDLHKIERYFTSIGRSFYRSEDFKELQKENKIKYKALSHFGIGFLSVFMVCEEVEVRTKSLGADSGINIHIPNYEGCFFIKNDDTILNVGTEITIYEDDRKLLLTKNIRKFIEENFLSFRYDICLSYPNNNITLNANNIQKYKGGFYIYVPFCEDDVVSTNKQNKSEDFEYGYFLPLNRLHGEENIYLNEGIKVNSCSISEFKGIPYCGIFNFPSSIINLNVSRDKIIDLKEGIEIVDFNKKLKSEIIEQFDHFIKNLEEDYKEEVSLLSINRLISASNKFKGGNKLNKEAYSLVVIVENDPLEGDLFQYIGCKNSNIDAYIKANSDRICFAITSSYLIILGDRIEDFVESYLPKKYLKDSFKKSLLKYLKKLCVESNYTQERFLRPSNYSFFLSKIDRHETTNKYMSDLISKFFEKIFSRNFSLKFFERIQEYGNSLFEHRKDDGIVYDEEYDDLDDFFDVDSSDEILKVNRTFVRKKRSYHDSEYVLSMIYELYGQFLEYVTISQADKKK